MQYLSMLGFMAIVYCIGLICNYIDYFYCRKGKDSNAIGVILSFIFASCAFLSFPIYIISMLYRKVWSDVVIKNYLEDNPPVPIRNSNPLFSDPDDYEEGNSAGEFSGFYSGFVSGEEYALSRYGVSDSEIRKIVYSSKEAREKSFKESYPESPYPEILNEP